MVDIKGFGISILNKKKSSSTGSTGAYNINYDTIAAGRDALIAGKIIDRLFGAIGDSIDRDGNRTSKTMRDLFLTEDTKLGVKNYVVRNENMVRELIKGIKEDLEIKE